MYKTSYEEITSTCKLINFTDSFTRVEEWRDSLYTYKCIWFESNISYIPSTITHEKNV